MASDDQCRAAWPIADAIADTAFPPDFDNDPARSTGWLGHRALLVELIVGLTLTKYKLVPRDQAGEGKK